MYRNPYDKNDTLFGASVWAGMEWEFEDGIEIIIKGKEVLEVREFLGYGEKTTTCNEISLSRTLLSDSCPVPSKESVVYCQQKIGQHL
ncbi:hypothetical protein [Paenibacillus sp. KN14-4R]|uniref:hypothetical protein n=1 Tax=Paenibacillus sp. KN14-4R TaxID=3445773 RepID=UPI003F9F97DC